MTYSYLSGTSSRQAEAPLLGYPFGIIYETKGGVMAKRHGRPSVQYRYEHYDPR
jgi:hypothetical protein